VKDNEKNNDSVDLINDEPTFFGDLIASIFGFGFLLPIGILAYQIYLWLKHGEWHPIPVSSALSYLDVNLTSIYNMEWQGAKKIILWLLNLPFSFVIFISTVVIGLWCLEKALWIDEKTKLVSGRIEKSKPILLKIRLYTLAAILVTLIGIVLITSIIGSINEY
jgi:hypothetical protein